MRFSAHPIICDYLVIKQEPTLTSPWFRSLRVFFGHFKACCQAPAPHRSSIFFIITTASLICHPRHLLPSPQDVIPKSWFER
jgi:hypothetical protein